MAFTTCLLVTLAVNREPYTDLIERIDLKKTANESDAFGAALQAIRDHEDNVASWVRKWYLLAVVTWVVMGVGPYRPLTVGAADTRQPQRAPVTTGILIQKQA